jgi:adenosyl cobinamide kinase/adenosyl cobinamide phosphate guanylyltransferase
LTLLVSNLLLQDSICPDEYPELRSSFKLRPGAENHSDVGYYLANDKVARAAIDQELDELQEAIRSNPADWILVSNEVGMGLVPPYPQGRIYRDLLGWANQRMASMADQVYFMVAGIPMRLTPEP